MPTNVSFEYSQAEKKYLQAKSDEEKLACLENMLKTMPGHKSAENLRANIRARYKKLKEKLELRKKKKKTLKKEGIKKEGIQVVLIGLTQSGKSSLLSILTNAQPLISNHLYTTKTETLGALNYQDIHFQIIDLPAINYKTFDQGLVNTTDVLLIVITKISDLEQILPFLEKSTGKKIVAFNKKDLLTEEERRKISAYLQSKRYSFAIVSCRTGEGIEQLKDKLIENSGVIRIYTKEPGRQTDKEPSIMKPNSTLKQLAEKIFHKSVRIKQIRVTGPSSKFSNQLVSLNHKLKDKDIVEFYVE